MKIAQNGSNLSLNFETEGGTRSVKFARVICAIPFTMLRQVEGIKALPLGRRKQEAIAQLGYGHNAKVMSGFTERWWRNPGGQAAGPEQRQHPDRSAFAMHLGDQPGSGGSERYSHQFSRRRRVEARTSERSEKFREELGRIFPGIVEKFDGKRAVMNWPEYKFARGSYTCPLVGQFSTLLEVAGEPELDGRLVFAGEHTAGEFSGFMSGAVHSGNRAAKEVLEPSTSERAKAA